jgi:flagellin-like hook-associated protein FlgL
MGDIVLSAGVRQNLLSLQSTADLMATTQNRLATGKRVNSALDNPGNFFTSQALNNRASDLNSLLDSIGQAQKTIEAADAGITSLTKLVESAKSIAKQARQAPQPSAITYGAVSQSGTFSGAETIAEATGGTFGANAIAGDAGNLVIDIGGTDYTVALAAGNDLDAFVTTFNNTAGLGSSGKVTASNDGGKLVLTANNADVDFTIDATSTAATLTKLGGGITSGTSYNSNSLLDEVGAGSLTLSVNGGAAQTITFGTNDGAGEVSTVAEFNAALAGLTGMTASSTSSGVSLSVASSSTQNSLTIGGTASVLTGLGLTANDYQGVASTSAPNATRASLQSDFNNVLSQIDALAKDTSYNGINLLNGDNLKVVFNEHGTSSLTISGVTFDAAGLGLNTVSGAGFQSDTDVDAILAAVGTALGTLRTQASAFGSTLTTVQTRQDFTKNLIRTLQTGADNLVLADTNEEGANMLALQTRQQLSTTALSLSAQADQAVLRLFG